MNWGMFSALGYIINALGNTHQCIGGISSLHWWYIITAFGDIMCAGGYHDLCGGISSVRWGRGGKGGGGECSVALEISSVR